MVGFAGWDMPVCYPPGQLKEHAAVRSEAGLFDVTHMGRYQIKGPGAHTYVQRLVTNNLDRISTGQLFYSPLCLETGGVIDDITCYRFDASCLIVVNASNRGSVWEWIQQHRPEDVSIQDRSDQLAQLALQGPRAQKHLAPLVAEDLEEIGYYHYALCTVLDQPEVLISRNGYTGEDGFEIYLPHEMAVRVWDALIDSGVSPIGLGARDTLRLEMCFALYGNELDAETSPLEAGLGWTVKTKKGDFIGREALIRQKEEGIRKVLVGFEVKGNRVPRHGQMILRDGQPVGKVTSGAPCPSLGKRPMGLGYVRPEFRSIDTILTIDIRGESVDAVVVERPFYKHGSHR
jgi:aminomethyltransferase